MTAPVSSSPAARSLSSVAALECERLRRAFDGRAVVDDVAAFPGHIACSSSTRSEIVVPVLSPSTGETLAVLDVDSDDPAAFDRLDQSWLESLMTDLARRFPSGEQRAG